MNAFEMETLMQAHTSAGKLYYEFLREPSLSLGIYVLPAGAEDPQQPHDEDEVYYVVNGRGQLMVDGQNRPVKPGSLVFVGKQVKHHFHAITEELQLLVFFAPAEGSDR